MNTTPIIENSTEIKNQTSCNFNSNKNNSEILISGLRLEGKDNSENFINKYTNDGIPIIEPKTEFKVVIFGYNLQHVDGIGFTVTGDCNDMIINVSSTNFMNITNKKIIFIAIFSDKGSIYNLCYLLKSNVKKYVFTKEKDINISTKVEPKKYIMPLWIQICVIVFCAILSGLFSGLNLGLMTLTLQELELITKSGSEQDQKYATVIIPIRKNGNFLLCSLIIGNVLVNSAISILMDDLTSGLISLISSSAGIVLFGEIIPQSLCVKKGLAVGAKTIWITKFFMLITFPISYPLSKLLDLVIGKEVTSYDRKKLMELIKMTTKNESAMEFKIAVGAMEITEKTVKDVMTKIEDVFMLPETTVLNEQKVTEIVNMGYTRIPVYANNNRNNVVSLLFIKDLALMDPDQNFTVKTVCSYHQHFLKFVVEDTPLKAMLEEFKKGQTHLAMVRKKKSTNKFKNVEELCGLITLEDILEEILKAEIVDETDIVIDNVNKVKRRTRNNKYLTNQIQFAGKKKSSFK
uniref:CNNM transmembrane domain-containing protein n=1 Tax=Strongyloides stercoralis TaxID=6248 RepID=A0A0K0EIG4_STRER